MGPQSPGRLEKDWSNRNELILIHSWPKCPHGFHDAERIEVRTEEDKELLLSGGNIKLFNIKTLENYSNTTVYYIFL